MIKYLYDYMSKQSDNLELNVMKLLENRELLMPKT